MLRNIMLLFCISVLFFSCQSDEKQAALDDLLLFEEENYSDTGRDVSNSRIRELEGQIQTALDEVTKAVDAYENLGLYYKLLATELMNLQMYGPALENIEKALDVYPENPVLFYLGGVSSARLGKSKLNEDDRMALYLLAESYYKRALGLQPRLKNALYGLGVLYVFELQRPEDAIPHLTLLSVIDKTNMDARFVLARAYYLTNDFQQAVEQYEYIMENASNPEHKSEASKNRELILN